MRLRLVGALGAMRKLLLTLPALFERKCCPNQAYVRKGLREVPQSLASCCINLLSIEAEIIAVFQQRAEKFFALLRRAAAQSQIFRLPKAANSKCPFLWLRTVAVKQPIRCPQLFAN